MKNKRKWIVMVLFAMAMTMCVSMNAEAAKVKLSKSKVYLVKGNTAALKVTGTSKKVKWSSSKKSVAKVSAKGKVTAKKKGTAVITAKVAGKKLKCTVKVFNKLTASQAEKAVANFCKSQKLKFYYLNAEKSGNKYIIWVTYTQTGMKSKYVVNAKTGAVKSYAPYFGVDMPAGTPAVEYKFSALKYL